MWVLIDGAEKKSADDNDPHEQQCNEINSDKPSTQYVSHCQFMSIV